MSKEYEIKPVYDNEPDEFKKRLMEIRFDCLVKMYDFGVIEKKKLPPQWFKLQLALTLEFIEHSDPCDIGIVIKKAFYDMKNHIDNFKDQNQ